MKIYRESKRDREIYVENSRKGKITGQRKFHYNQGAYNVVIRNNPSFSLYIRSISFGVQNCFVYV